MRNDLPGVRAHFTQPEYALLCRRLETQTGIVQPAEAKTFLSAEECKRFAPRLFELADAWSDADPLKEKAMALVVKMGDCADTDGYLRLV